MAAALIEESEGTKWEPFTFPLPTLFIHAASHDGALLRMSRNFVRNESQ
jgi:hypothetical protein